MNTPFDQAANGRVTGLPLTSRLNSKWTVRPSTRAGPPGARDESAGPTPPGACAAVSIGTKRTRSPARRPAVRRLKSAYDLTG